MKKINNHTVRWLISVPRFKIVYIVILMVLQALHGASGVFYALLLRNIVDAATAHARDQFWKNVILAVMLIVGQIALRAIIRRMNELSKSSFENLFKDRLLKNILNKDYSVVSAIHSGEWLNRLTNDTVVIATGYVDVFPGLAGMIVKMLSALVMIIALDKSFAYILIPGGILMLVLTYLFRKVIKRLHKQVQEQDGKLRIFLQERISSLMVVHSFAAEKQTEVDAMEKMNSHKDARMKKNMFSNFCNIGFGFAINGIYLFSACYCGYGILMNTISYGTLTAITQLITQIQAPFANLTGYLPKIYAMLASAERLMEIEGFETVYEGEDHSLQETKDYYKNKLSSFGIKNVSFTYYPSVEKIENLSKDNMPAVLNGISVELKKGEYVAFTGHSGCGKSTVLKLLMSIYRPDSGECFIRDNSGNTEALSVKWHKLFAYVPQGNQLMSGTIREIITFSNKKHSDNTEKINFALKIACADEFVKELDNGIDTVLGERGTGLSEGQMQRIAVARAIFSDSPILLFDEATSALDEQTEKDLLENLRKMTDKTVLIVTHRPAALSICDRILKFKENGIEEI